MRVLVLGGGGPIGKAVARSLLNAGHDVAWTSRSLAPPDAVASHRRVDRADPIAVVDIVRERAVDVVVDMVAYTLDSTRPLLTALSGRIARYVLISSSDVYRNYALLQRREIGEPDPGLLAEDAPLRTSRFPYRGAQPRAADDPARWMDDYDKIPIEDAVRGMTGDWTILRLPMVFGPGDRQRRFRWATAPMLARRPTLEAPAAWLDWTTTYGYIDNVGSAVARAAVHPQAAGQIFNVADDASVSHRTWIDWFGAATGWRGEVRVSANPDTPIAAATAALDLTVPLRTSAARLVQALSFQPPVSRQSAIQRTLAEEASLTSPSPRIRDRPSP